MACLLLLGNIQTACARCRTMTSQPVVSGALHAASNDSLNSEGSQPRIRGHIDTCESGRLSGWMHDESNPTSRLEVQVYSQHEIVGCGVADQYREDLEQAGIGDSCCAYSVPLYGNLYNGLGHELAVVETVTGECIGSISCKDPVFASTWVELIHTEVLRGHIELAHNEQQDDYIVELLVDGAVFSESQTIRQHSAGRRSVDFKLPSILYDDEYHFFNIQIKGLTTSSEPDYLKLASVTTHWEHIKDSFASANISALSKSSAYRYRALQSHLRSIEKDNHSLSLLASVQLAHDVLARGIERRKTYPKLTLPAVTDPDITIVIPVHNEFEYTYNCIASLILAYNKKSFEVVLVDDKSTDQTTEVCRYIDNLHVVVNEKNLGFLRTAEAGANVGTGQYIVFLNNDTEVVDGWLDSLFAPFEEFDSVGMTGAKLIYPNGQLQEAGGAVALNGQPWNVGNRKNPEDPAYNYLRQADYLSGAAMMVDRTVWKQVGGFSKEFIPAYYEDTDLAFKIRDAGYKTLFTPSAIVVHYEGMSNGRDLDVGYKKFQNVNAPRFRSKWRHVYRFHGEYGINSSLGLDRDKDFQSVDGGSHYSKTRPGCRELCCCAGDAFVAGARL